MQDETRRVDPDALEELLDQRMRHHIGRIAAKVGTRKAQAVADSYERDPLFSIFGLYGPRYLTARFGGGLNTSIHRKVGDLVEDSVQHAVINGLDLDPGKAVYRANLESGDVKVVRTADCFIDFGAMREGHQQDRVRAIARRMRDALTATHFDGEPEGIGFEIRGCYQSADSKRAQADDAMARHLASRNIVPLMLVFCGLSNESIMRRYRGIWHLHEGASAFDTVYELTDFDLRGFWIARQEWIHTEINRAFDRLSPE